MARTAASPLVTLFFLLLLTAPLPALSLPFYQFKTLLSLAHSLMSRVANLRASRGDFAGSQRAMLIANSLDRGLGLGFLGSMRSLAWDYAKNDAWRDRAFSELNDAVPEMNELLKAFAELTESESNSSKASWVSRNYQSVFRACNSLLQGLIKTFLKSVAWKDLVETIRVEVREGGLVKDCLELLTAPLPALSLHFYQFQTLLSLGHSLMSRVANLRASRGDFAGSQRAMLIANSLDRVLGLEFLGSMRSLAWDYAKNYAWRDHAFSELNDAVPEMNELLKAFAELTKLESNSSKASWVSRNYQSVLRACNSLLQRLLKAFLKSERGLNGSFFVCS